MTIYYIDPEGGNDANTGLSFAQRWKSFAPTSTHAPAANDEYRVMASRAAQNLGLGAWVDNQDYVTLTTPPFQVVSTGEDLWTAVTGVVTELWPYTSSEYTLAAVVSTNRITVNGSTTTGKIAYLALASTLDLSAYTHLSVLTMKDFSSVLLPNVVLNLCSDAVGAVPLVSLPLEFMNARGYPQLLTNGGAALPSGINSISLSLSAAPGGTFRKIYFEGLVACKGPDDPLHISHSSLISKQTAGAPEWVAVRGFRSGGKVYFGYRSQYTTRVWRGDTETLDTWVRTPTRPKWTVSSSWNFTNIRDGVKISGGWDRTDMSTQADVTWVSGDRLRNSTGGEATAFLEAVGQVDGHAGNPAIFNKIGLANYNAGPVRFAAMTMHMHLEGLANCLYGNYTLQGKSIYDVGDVTFCENGPFRDNGFELSLETGAVVTGRKILGCGFVWLPPTGLGTGRIKFQSIENCKVAMQQGRGLTRINDTLFRWNLWDGYFTNCADGWYSHCTFDNALGEPGITVANPGGTVRLDVVNGNAWDSRVIGPHMATVVETPVRTAGKRSLFMGHNGGYNEYPLQERVALIPVRGGETVTISGYVWKATQDLAVSLSTLDAYTPGVGHVKATGQRRPLRWARVVLEVTPTADGLLPVFLEMEGLGSGTVYATEVQVDTSGLPADPPDVLTLFQTMTFTGAVDDYYATYPAVVAGTALAEANLLSTGTELVHMTDGTLDPDTGDFQGFVYINSGAGFENIVIMLNTSYESAEITGSRLVIKDGATVILDTTDLQGTDFGTFSMLTGATGGLVMTAGVPYTLEFYRYL